LNPRTFSLIPFQSEDDDRQDLMITGRFGCRDGLLSIRYVLRGNLSDLYIPAPEDTPARKDRLWETTCLELFLGTKGSGTYWECNLSPSGDWNVYRFTGYREGMQEEAAFSSLPFTVRIGQDAIELSLELNVGRIMTEGETIEAGVAAVIATIDGRKSYWALTHPRLQPDFHIRKEFGLTIPFTQRMAPGSSWS